MNNLNIAKINQIINQAQAAPFENHYVVTKDKRLVEECFLNQTATLFNIEIITYGEMIAMFKDRYCCNNIKTVDSLRATVWLKEHLDTHKYQTFNNSSYPTCASLFATLLKIHNYEADFENINQLAQLSKAKLQEIKTIVELFGASLEKDTRLSLEDDLIARLDHQLQNDHFHFFLPPTTTKQNKLIGALAQVAQVEVLDYASWSPTPLANQLQENFFANDAPCDLKTPFCLWKSGTAYEQYRLVVDDIFTKVTAQDYRYRDFAIIVNNPSDRLEITKLLDEFDLPSNGQLEVKNNSYEALRALARYLGARDLAALVGFLTNPVVINPQKAAVVPTYLKTGQVDSSLIDQLNLDQHQTIAPMALALKEFVNANFATTPETLEIVNALATLEQFDTPVTSSDFFDLVFLSVKPRPTKRPLLEDHIQILDLASAMIEPLNIKTAYVLNFTEANIPTPIKNNQLLLDDELASLKLPIIKEQLEYENQLVLNLYCAKIDQLVCCVPANLLAGDTQLMASLLKSLMERYNHQKWSIKTDFTHPKLKDARYGWHQYDRDDVKLNAIVENFLHSHNQPRPVALAALPTQLSPSQIELYNSCPYKYYLQYVAKINKIEPASMQANQVGSYIHYLIEQSRPFIEDYDRKKLEAHLAGISQSYLDDHRIIPSAPNQLVAKLILEDLPNTIAVLNKQYQLGHSRIMATEKYTRIQRDDLALHGKIDRVNVTGDFVDVIDYKGSQKALKDELLKLGVNIQMLLYLQMISQEQQLEPGGVFYFNYTPKMIKVKEPISTYHLDSGALLKEYRLDALINEAHVDDIEEVEPQSDALVFKGGRNKDGSFKKTTPLKSSSEFGELFDQIISYVAKLDSQLKSGNITIAPIVSDSNDRDHLKPCTYCDYKTICNFDIFYNEYRDLSKEVKADESK